MKMQKYRPKITIERTAHLIGHGAMFVEVEISPDQIWYRERDEDDIIETDELRLHHKGVKIRLRGVDLKRFFERVE